MVTREGAEKESLIRKTGYMMKLARQEREQNVWGKRGRGHLEREREFVCASSRNYRQPAGREQRQTTTTMRTGDGKGESRDQTTFDDGRAEMSTNTVEIVWNLKDWWDEKLLEGANEKPGCSQ